MSRDIVPEVEVSLDRIASAMPEVEADVMRVLLELIAAIDGLTQAVKDADENSRRYR